MFRNIRRLFSKKKRSETNLGANKVEFSTINENIDQQSAAIFLDQIPENSSNRHKFSEIVAQVLVHEPVSATSISAAVPGQLGKSHHHDSSKRRLSQESIRRSKRIFRRNSAASKSITYEDQVESNARDNEMHKHILDDVAEFYQQFSNLQTDVRILISKNVIIYVLGTNHANTQCKEDVIDIIKKVRPKTVLVELCSLRACSCKKHRSNAFQSTPKFTFRYLRAIITQLGFLPAMIFFTDVFREHLVAESSLLHYGGEFIAAMATAQSLQNCRIVLADRPIEITVKRQASAMGNWRGLKVTLQVTLALMFKKQMKRLMLNANRLVFDDPKTYEVLVFERDLFLTYSIQEATREYEHLNSLSRVVAVIGQGHMQGIQTYWGKVPSEFIPFIMSPQTILD